MATATAILTALSEILTLGYKAYVLFREAKLKGWVSAERTLSQQITEAKTDEERKALAQLLFNSRAQ